MVRFVSFDFDGRVPRITLSYWYIALYLGFLANYKTHHWHKERGVAKLFALFFIAIVVVLVDEKKKTRKQFAYLSYAGRIKTREEPREGRSPFGYESRCIFYFISPAPPHCLEPRYRTTVHKSSIASSGCLFHSFWAAAPTEFGRTQDNLYLSIYLYILPSTLPYGLEGPQRVSEGFRGP